MKTRRVPISDKWDNILTLTTSMNHNIQKKSDIKSQEKGIRNRCRWFIKHNWSGCSKWNGKKSCE